MAAERMPEVVVAHDVAQRVHPSFEPAIHQITDPRDVVRPDLATSRIALLSFRAEEHDVEVHEVKVAKRLLRA